MDHQRKLKYQHDVEKYLEDNKVYSIFEDMMKSLIIRKPDDPIDFLIKKLSEPECINFRPTFRKENFYNRPARIQGARVSSISCRVFQVQFCFCWRSLS